MNSISPAEKTAVGRGSDVLVKAADPVRLIHDNVESETGLGQERICSCGDPSSARATERKVGDAIAAAGASNGVHLMEGGVDSSGDRAASKRCFY